MELELARLTLANDPALVPPAAGFARAVAAGQGVPVEDLDALELAVQAACRNVLEHAYEPGQQATYQLSLSRRPTQLVLEVEDQGIPMDVQRLEAGQGARGLSLMRQFADEIHFRNLGTHGKRVELIKNLPYRDLEAYLKDQPEVAAPEADAPLELRLMRAEDGPSLARCVYRSYGYSYVRDAMYYPEKAAQLIGSGLMISAVAVTPEGEIVSHLALTRNSLDEKIADSGQAVTDPRFRGKHLFTDLKKLLGEEAARRGFYGIYSEAVTVHPYTQKGTLAVGGHEIGLLLGFAPATVHFRQIADDPGGRTAAMLTYTRVNPEPARTIHVPERHRPLIERIVGALALNRAFGEPAPLEGPSRVDLRLVPELNAAIVRVHESGTDLLEVLRRHLSSLCRQGIDLIYVDFALSQPETAAAVEVAEQAGFFFGGLIPEALPEGDVFRLQFLNEVKVDPEAIKTASDLGRALLDYVLAERARRAEQMTWVLASKSMVQRMDKR